MATAITATVCETIFDHHVGRVDRNLVAFDV